MSIADRRNSRRHGQAGFTFVEMAFTMAIIVVLAVIIERTLAATHSAEQYLDVTRRATERGQKISWEMHELVSQSRKLYQDDTEGRAYLAACELPFTVLSTARLPLIDETGRMGPDVDGDPHTGSILLFAMEGDPYPAWSDPVTKTVRYVDTYRFVCVYPHETDRTIVTGGGLARDLVIWISEAYPSRAQLMGISDSTERTNVVKDLFVRFGCDTAWDPNEPVDAALFAMDYLGTLASVPDSAPLLAEDVEDSPRGRLEYTNLQLARTDPASPARRAVFTVDDPGVWSPDGLEVKITGASGSRQVWLRLTIEGQSGKDRTAVHGGSVIASTRDL